MTSSPRLRHLATENRSSRFLGQWQSRNQLDRDMEASGGRAWTRAWHGAHPRRLQKDVGKLGLGAPNHYTPCDQHRNKTGRIVQHGYQAFKLVFQSNELPAAPLAVFTAVQKSM